MNFYLRLLYFIIIELFAFTVKPQSNGRKNSGDYIAVKQLFDENKVHEAVVLCNRMIEKSQNEKNKTKSLELLSLKSDIYLESINGDSSKVISEFVLNESYKIKFITGIVNSLHSLGRYYYRSNNYSTAIKYFSLLNNYSVQIADTLMAFKSNYYLASAYSQTKFYSKALAFSTKNLQLAKSMMDTNLIIKSYVNLASVNIIIDSLDDAENWGQRAINLLEKSSKKIKSSSVYNTLTKINLIRGNKLNAVAYGKLTIDACLKEGDLFNVSIYYDNLAYAYMLSNNLDSAIVYFEKAIEANEQSKSYDEIRTELIALGNIYTKQNKPDKVLLMLTKYSSIDSTYRIDDQILLDSIKSGFEAEKNKIKLVAETKRISEEYQQKRAYYIIISVIVLFFAVVLFYALYLRHSYKKQKEQQALLHQLKDAEIISLKTQMNPHFIFNSLNSVLQFIQTSQKTEATEYIIKFSRLIRNVLENSENKHILLKDEIDFLKLYVDLEQIRFAHNFSFTVEIDDKIDIYNTVIPSLLIQPFIENAIIHGIQNRVKLKESENKAFKGVLKLTIYCVSQKLTIKIEDNGVGINKAKELNTDKMYNHKSMGMRITKDRIALLNQNNGSVVISEIMENSIVCGTSVEILLPLIENC